MTTKTPAESLASSLADYRAAPARVERRTGAPSYGMLTAVQRARLDALVALVEEAR